MAVDVPQESPKKISEFSHHPRPVAINFKFRPKIQRKSAILGPFFHKILEFKNCIFLLTAGINIDIAVGCLSRCYTTVVHATPVLVAICSGDFVILWQKVYHRYNSTKTKKC